MIFPSFIGKDWDFYHLNFCYCLWRSTAEPGEEHIDRIVLAGLADLTEADHIAVRTVRRTVHIAEADHNFADRIAVHTAAHSPVVHIDWVGCTLAVHIDSVVRTDFPHNLLYLVHNCCWVLLQW